MTPTVVPTKVPTTQPTDTPSFTPTPSPSPAPTSSVPNQCGCATCTSSVLNTMAGDYSCGDRINFLRSNGYSEAEACKQVAGVEFSGTCGPMCDPDLCTTVPTPVTPYPTYISAPPSPLYCYPAEDSRVSYENIWGAYTVQVKERDSPCGPGGNLFSSSTVSLTGNEISLKFKKNSSGHWESSEVRVFMRGQAFKYGNYKFHVKSVDVIGPSGTVSSVLPNDLVLGLFTWDDTERYDVHENHNHEVDVEISRWGSSNNGDVQFLMQPPGNPQMYRFFSGSDGTSYNQSDQWYSFEWLPSKISWASTAGGGQTHEYTTENAVISGQRDYIQCLPAEVEIRMNLWNFRGMTTPTGMTDDQYVEVVIDNFVYEPSAVLFAGYGDYCSKHCQCAGLCVNGRCEEVNPGTSSFPSPSTTPFTPSPCGCKTCIDQVLDTMAGAYSCRARIDWLQTLEYSEYDACVQISHDEYPTECGLCNPLSCGTGSRRYLRTDKT